MRKRILGSMTALLAGTGLALGQAPSQLPPVSSVPAPVLQTPAPEGTTTPPAARTAAPAAKQLTPQAATSDSNSYQPCEKCFEAAFLYPGQFYSTAEYLLWWTKGDKLPPLVTTGQPATLTTTGALGQPGTQVLFGDQAVDDDLRSGGRFTVGYWLNNDQTVGWDASFFFTAENNTDFHAQSNGATVLARPFTNLDLVNRGLVPNLAVNPNNALLVAYPSVGGLAFAGSASGNVSVLTSNSVWGLETNARINMAGNSQYRADMLVGFRYLNVEDQLNITSVSQPSSGSVVVFRDPPTLGPTITNARSVTVSDIFNTRNNFYGGQVGARIDCRRGRLSGEMIAKLALGCVNQNVDIQGSSTLVQTNGVSTTVPGGLLAQTSNIGDRSRNVFGIIPELGFNVGYNVTNNIRGFVGYSVLYWRADVVRPGKEIDPIVNPALVPTLNNPLASNQQQRPAFQFVDDDFWAQGVNFGIEFTF